MRYNSFGANILLPAETQYIDGGSNEGRPGTATTRRSRRPTFHRQPGSCNCSCDPLCGCNLLGFLSWHRSLVAWCTNPAAPNTSTSMVNPISGLDKRHLICPLLCLDESILLISVCSSELEYRRYVGQHPTNYNQMTLTQISQKFQNQV